MRLSLDGAMLTTGRSNMEAEAAFRTRLTPPPAWV
jgi:hypothetical protein